MVCKNCGNEMRDDARFCPSCGAMNAPDMGGGPSAPSAPAWEGPEGGGNKKKTGLLIGAGIAAVAVVALLAVAASGLFSSPKGQVEKAFAKTAAAYKAAEEKLGMPDTYKWQRERTIKQDMALELKGINSQLAGYDLSAFNGLGLRLGTDYDGPGRQMSFDLGAYWGEEDLLSFQMAADDNEMYLRLPQFTGDTYYGMNTETLGADLSAMTGDSSMDSVSFNIFELVDKAIELADPAGLEESMGEANKALLKAMEVKKLGAKTLDLNGTDTKTTAYRAVIPQEALERYVDDLADMMSVLNYYELYEEIYQAMGMPREQIDEIMSALEEFDMYGELAGVFRAAVDELGDLELDICVSGGYVSAVLYQGSVGGADVEMAVYLGGGEEYVDDISAVIEVEGSTIEMKSSGDHGLKRGVFTDETTVRIRDGGSTLARVTSEMSVDPKGKGDNFQWKLGVDSSGLSILVLEMEGGLDIGQDFISVDLEEISVRTMGMEVCTLGFSYYIDCHPEKADVGGSVMLADMSVQDLMDAALEIEGNATRWASDMEELFISRLPVELFWAMAGAL